MTGYQRSTYPAKPHNLPQHPTSLVGREVELAEIARMLADPACRLLTFVGPGGIGKTRLAIQAATAALGDPASGLSYSKPVPPGATGQEPSGDSVRLTGDWERGFAHGVYLIRLESLREPRHLATVVADALRLSLSGQDEPLVQLQRHLSQKRMLLVLDNFEHLLDGVEIIGDLLQAAPGVKLLVTSRVALQLLEEWLYPVGGLPVPEGGTGHRLGDAADPAGYDAVRLFADRARRVRPDFSLADEQEGVVRICQLVEGMPLAIELAASWTKMLRCADIAAEIEQGMGFLATSLRNVPDRHRSMQAVFDGSWGLLTEKEQETYQQLSVFRGGFRRRAAEEMTGASLPVLAALVDQSLLRWTPTSSTAFRTGGRYHIHDLLRQCAEERLAESAEQVKRAYDAHCTYFSAYLAWVFDDLLGGRQREGAAEVEAELENIRAAWQWAIEQGRIEEIRGMVLPLSLFYQLRGRYVEGAEAMDEAARRLTGMAPSKEVERALIPVRMDQAWLYIRLGRLEQAEEKANQCRELYQRLGIPHIHGQGTDPLLALGVVALARGDYAAVVRYGDEARRASEAQDHRPNRQVAYYLLARAAMTQGDHEAAEQYAWQAYATAKELGDYWFMSYCLNELGSVASALGDYVAARGHFEASYAIRQGLEDPEGMAVALNHLAGIAMHQGEYGEAQRLFADSFDIYQEIGDRGGTATSLGGLGRSAAARGDYPAAARHLLEALRISAGMQFVSLVLSLLADIGELLLQTGRPGRGVELLALVLHHPGSEEETREQALRLLDQQQGEMDHERFASAGDRGREQCLETMVEALQVELANLDQQIAPLPGSADRCMPTGDQPLVEPLTPRELEVLHLIAEGQTNKQIAEELILSVGTVKYYTSHIYGKLGVSSRTQAVAQARELDLLP